MPSSVNYCCSGVMDGGGRSQGLEVFAHAVGGIVRPDNCSIATVEEHAKVPSCSGFYDRYRACCCPHKWKVTSTAP